MSNRPIRIAMWSGPRNISTAMMRSFESRSDCAVTDEPFYGAFLKQTGEPQPMAEQVITSMGCDWQSVAETMRGPIPGDKSIWYQKHMPHHMVGEVSITDFSDHRHAFLIRNPVRVVASYAAKRVEVTVDDLGYSRQLEYVDQAAQMAGKAPAILDSNDILRNPEAGLKILCDGLAINWDAAMLNWKSGRRETDGVWGEHWYNRVIDTTGFGMPEDELPKLTEEQMKTADQCREDYEKLSAMKTTVSAL